MFMLSHSGEWRSYGARCDGRSNDTAAFQATVAAAGAEYRERGVPVTVKVVGDCVVPNTGASPAVPASVTIGSGVILSGPGKVTVPYQRQGVFLFLDASDCAVRDLTIHVLGNPGGNFAGWYGIGWAASGRTGANYHNFSVTNTTVLHSNWGILVAYLLHPRVLLRIDQFCIGVLCHFDC